MTVAELLSRISSRELSEWMAYYELEPFGEERADLRAGIIAATIANVNRSKKQRAFQPAQFMPKFGGEPEKETQSWQQQLAIVQMLNAALGGSEVQRSEHDRDPGGKAEA